MQDERERAHLLERDRDTLAYNVKRMTSERDAVANERVGLEEKVLNLEVLMADLKDEFGDSDGRLGMVPEIVSELLTWRRLTAEAADAADVERSA